jgi:hypothetical protein
VKALALVDFYGRVEDALDDLDDFSGAFRVYRGVRNRTLPSVNPEPRGAEPAPAFPAAGPHQQLRAPYAWSLLALPDPDERGFLDFRATRLLLDARLHEAVPCGT